MYLRVLTYTHFTLLRHLCLATNRRTSLTGVTHPVLYCAVPCCAAGSSIRLKGRNLTESEHIKLGAYHTLELEPNRAFTLGKALWDSLDVERIRAACDPQASADLAAVLITVRAPHSWE